MYYALLEIGDRRTSEEERPLHIGAQSSAAQQLRYVCHRKTLFSWDTAREWQALDWPARLF